MKFSMAQAREPGFSAAAKHFQLSKAHMFLFYYQLCLTYSFSVILTIWHSFGNYTMGRHGVNMDIKMALRGFLALLVTMGTVRFTFTPQVALMITDGQLTNDKLCACAASS